MIKIEDEEYKLYRITNLVLKVEKIITALREKRAKDGILGNIDIISTLSPWDKLRNSETYGKMHRLEFIVYGLKKKGLNPVVFCLFNDEDEKREGSGGNFFNFGPFGGYSSSGEIDNNYSYILRTVEGITPKSWNKTETEFLTKLLIARIKAIMKIPPSYIPESLRIGENNDSIKYMSLMDFLTSKQISLEDWKKKEWFKEEGVLFFGDFYKEGDESLCLPNGVTSQAIQLWRYKSRSEDDKIVEVEVDSSALNLLQFEPRQYINEIKDMAAVLRKEVPIKPIKDIILKYL